MFLLLASPWGRDWPFLLKLQDSSNPWTVLIINFVCNEFLEIGDSSHIKQIVPLILIDFLPSKKFLMENFSHTESRDTLVPPLQSASKKFFLTFSSLISSSPCSQQLLVSFFFFFFLDVDHLKNLYWIWYNIASVLCFFCLFVFWPQSMWDCSSLTRDRTHTPALEGKVLTTGPPGTPLNSFFKLECLWKIQSFIAYLWIF